MKAIHERSTLTFWMGLGFVQRKYRVSCGLGARKLRIMHSEVVANYSCPGSNIFSFRFKNSMSHSHSFPE